MRSYLVPGAILLCILFLFASCGKTSQTNWAYYDETYCADAWTYSTVNETLKDNCVAYMKTKGITVLDIEIYTDRDSESSSSCSNKTGRRIKCKVSRKELSEIKAQGFYE